MFETFCARKFVCMCVLCVFSLVGMSRSHVVSFAYAFGNSKAWKAIAFSYFLLLLCFFFCGLGGRGES